MNVLLTFLLIISASASFALNAEQEILRLEKGEYYYHYLTGDFPSAMNQLKQWRFSEDAIADEADVMEAAMLLSLGLHEQAQVIFDQIQQQGNNASSQAWFYLARRWYELAEYESALLCIQNIQPQALRLDTLGEAQFMKAASLIELGEYKKAQVMIANMPRASIWTGYARHNYILAMFEGNNSGQSLALLIEDATFYLPDSEEGRNLRDRIHLISALHFLQSGKNRSAEKHLKEVSLAGPYTPAALLQFGWAKVEQKQYESALQPWRELQTRFNRFDPEVMESMLGVPHVLELMQANTQALKIYEMTEKSLLAMKSLLTQINADLAENPWLEEWVSQQKDQSWGWQAKIETILPLNDTSAVLQQLLSDKKIVNQMTQYRDLLLLTDYLAEKEEGLQLWLTLVDKREQKSKTRVVIPVLNQAETDIKAAKRELKSLQNYLQQSDSEQFALPNDKEEKKTQLLSNTASRIERLMQVNKASRNMNVYQQRWLRVKGVFLWQMNDDRKNKQWHLKKQLVAMNRLIKRAEIQLLETRLANQWSPAAWVGMKEKVVTLLGKTSALKKVAEQAKAESKRALITDSKTYLSTLTHRINDYLSQTRLSIARLYDEALQNYVASGELKERSSNND
jgi:tetratricopeptide (TPR) repeat protein